MSTVQEMVLEIQRKRKQIEIENANYVLIIPHTNDSDASNNFHLDCCVNDVLIRFSAVSAATLCRIKTFLMADNKTCCCPSSSMDLRWKS